MGDLNRLSILDDGSEQQKSAVRIIRNNKGADIALIKLSEPIAITKSVRPIPLISSTYDSFLDVGKTAFVSGWGELATGGQLPQLQYAQVTITRCGGWFPSKKLICTDLQTSKGDSGGPLVVWGGNAWRLAGVIAGSNSNIPSLNPRDVATHTRVSEYITWIDENIGNPFRLIPSPLRSD